MSTDNEDLVRRVEEAWDANNLDALDELFAPDFFSHTAVPGMPPGLAGAKLAHQASMSAFPDRKMTIDDLVAAGDRSRCAPPSAARTKEASPGSVSPPTADQSR